MKTGDPIVYRNVDMTGADIEGIASEELYFVVVDSGDSSKIRFATSKADAVSETPNTIPIGSTNESGDHRIEDARRGAAGNTISVLVGLLPSVLVSSRLVASETSGTRALISDGPVVRAGRHIDVIAREKLTNTQVRGGLAGSFGIGAGGSASTVTSGKSGGGNNRCLRRCHGRRSFRRGGTCHG